MDIDDTTRVDPELEYKVLFMPKLMKEKIEEMLNYVQSTKIKFNEMEDIPSETEAVLKDIENLEGLMAALLPIHLNIQKLNSAADKMMKDNTFKEVASVEDSVVGDLNERWKTLSENFATRLARLMQVLVMQNRFKPILDILQLWLDSLNNKICTWENFEFIDQKIGQLQMILTELQHREQAIILVLRETLHCGEEDNFQAMQRSLRSLNDEILLKIDQHIELLTEREQQLQETDSKTMNEETIKDEIHGLCMKKFEINLSAKFLLCISIPTSDEFQPIAIKWKELLKVLRRCVMLCPEEPEEIEKACWSLIEFDLPDYPFQRSAIAIPRMIEAIVHMAKSFKQQENIPNKDDIITWFNILYVLQINENTETQSLDKVEEIIRSVTSAKSTGAYIETENLYRALKYLNEIVQMEVEQQNHGLIDVECFISKAHKLILDKLPQKQGGIFSTKERFVRVDTKTYFYPKYDTVESARRVVQIVIDKYNALNEMIKKLFSKDSKIATEKLYKLSGLLLFMILDYHPFGDGNGRLARLLSSYALSLVTPFSVPIYGLFSPSTREEYISALIEARKDNNIPRKLTALIIESNYYAWKKFTEVIETAKDGANWKLLLVTYARKAEK